MFWLINGCQNSVSADQYHLTVSRAQVSTHWVRVLFWRYLLTSCYFSNDRRLKCNFFLKFIWNKSCQEHICFWSRSWAALLKYWFWTDLWRENSTGFNIYIQGIAFDFSHCHALITLYVQLYVLIGQNLIGEFMRKIYAASGNLLTDSWSWQSFVLSCNVLNCLFLLGVQNEIQLLSRLFCNSWLVCLLRFLLTNAPLVKVIGNPISDGIVFKNELTHLPLLEA